MFIKRRWTLLDLSNKTILDISTCVRNFITIRARVRVSIHSTTCTAGNWFSISKKKPRKLASQYTGQSILSSWKSGMGQKCERLGELFIFSRVIEIERSIAKTCYDCCLCIAWWNEHWWIWAMHKVEEMLNHLRTKLKAWTKTYK